ncbi:lipoprotein [Cellvibrio sp. pealriver]|uniref:LPS translocon maturation chaperone LptM n=1 Tax=Cellvibrio sp. pealriver TaxID=1622269 RepID=UPI000AD17B44|nr:lipoprotein [Cellvibrio sp. pealriver]
MKITAACLLFCIGLGGCGQKGPLYLPQPAKPQPEVSQPDTPEPTQPRQDESSSSADPA